MRLTGWSRSRWPRAQSVTVVKWSPKPDSQADTVAGSSAQLPAAQPRAASSTATAMSEPWPLKRQMAPSVRPRRERGPPGSAASRTSSLKERMGSDAGRPNARSRPSIRARLARAKASTRDPAPSKSTDSVRRARRAVTSSSACRSPSSLRRRAFTRSPARRSASRGSPPAWTASSAKAAWPAPRASSRPPTRLAAGSRPGMGETRATTTSATKGPAAARFRAPSASRVAVSSMSAMKRLLPEPAGPKIPMARGVAARRCRAASVSTAAVPRGSTPSAASISAGRTGRASAAPLAWRGADPGGGGWRDAVAVEVTSVS